MPVSPTKPSAPAATRACLTANLKKFNLARELSTADFSRAFFRNHIPEKDHAHYLPKDASTIVDTIRCSDERTAYEPTCKLLTGICDNYARIHNVTKDQQLAFVPHPDHAPCHHPHSYTAEVAKQRPDLLVTKKWLARLHRADVQKWKQRPGSLNKPALAWPRGESLVEGKGPHEADAHFQAATYLGSLMQARPDLIGCFGLAIDSQNFRLLWCDVSGVYFSETISWEDELAFPALVQYIHELHAPRLDPSIRLQAPETKHDQLSFQQWVLKSYASPPVWLVERREDEKDGKVEEVIVYIADKILSVGVAWSRKNWLARATHTLTRDGHREELPTPVVIKDSFINPDRAELSSEGDILEHIHRNGQLPGVVSMISHSVVKIGAQPIGNIQLPPDMDDKLRFPTRVRYRIFLVAYEVDHIFTACSSMQDFLMVMYDVLEMSKYLHEEHGVTHRDITPFNILRRPDSESAVASIPEPLVAKQGPVFIRRLLSYNDPEPHPNMPTCILLDFDNAFLTGRATGAVRSASAGFIARIHSLGRVIARDRVYPLPRIEALEGVAKDAYLRFHGSERYELAGAFHDNATVAPLNNPPRSNAWPHVPRHDAESAFYVISWFSMWALPAGASTEEDDTAEMSRHIVHLESHCVKESVVDDPRNVYFGFDKDSWEAILHRDFRSCAPFLAKLVDAVAPEYGWVTSALNPAHLHEAMQRLILEEICRLRQAGNPLNIDRQIRRKAVSPGAANVGLAATAPNVHAARSAHDQAVSEATGEARLKKSRKRSQAASWNPRESGSVVAPSGGTQKKQKTAKEPSAPSRFSNRQRQLRGE